MLWTSAAGIAPAREHPPDGRERLGGLYGIVLLHVSRPHHHGRPSRRLSRACWSANQTGLRNILIHRAQLTPDGAHAKIGAHNAHLGAATKAIRDPGVADHIG